MDDNQPNLYCVVVLPIKKTSHICVHFTVVLNSIQFCSIHIFKLKTIPRETLVNFYRKQITIL